MPQINKMMGIGSPGLVAGFPVLSDEWRWRYLRITMLPKPRHRAARRCGSVRHENGYFHFGVTIDQVEEKADGLILTMTKGRRLETDFIILGTGFDTDPRRQPLSSRTPTTSSNGATDTPRRRVSRTGLANFPYLNSDFSFKERNVGQTPWVEQIHCFNYGSRCAGQCKRRYTSDQ